MVDFAKRLSKSNTSKKIDPLELYETLDRASDKGPLRPAQEAVLREWHSAFRSQKDVILKLHTGQGKTLVGLLMLQSKLNETSGPSLYLCPNKFLVEQTSIQATQFGIKHVTIDSGKDLPEEFQNGKSLLITHVQMLFNGLTKFKLQPHSTKVSSLVLDDAHACIDSIKSACTIEITKEKCADAYNELFSLFDAPLKEQGLGTYNDIKINGTYDSFLAVPYWDWRDKIDEVTAILSKYNSQNSIKFAWPILKNILADCMCVISGTKLEITPYSPPLHMFGTFDKANTRIFMSATVSDDAFLVKGLSLSSDTIKKPLTYSKERWSGEKMIVIPSLVDDSIDRSAIVQMLAPTKPRDYGIVALCPSFKGTADWQNYGAEIANKENIETVIDRLKGKQFDRVAVIANRYDGIDLPDDTCRLLVLDSKPFSEQLSDAYVEGCRSTSDYLAKKVARIVEQGLGRSVRGEKDYSVIVVLGPDLIKTIRTKEGRKYFSNQTQTQIEIGLEIAEMAEEDIRQKLKPGQTPLDTIICLINQCIRRDPNWKEFYREGMEKMPTESKDNTSLDIYAEELRAEKAYLLGDYEESVRITQQLIDNYINDEFDKAWYFQEIARYIYPQSKLESNNFQIQAHKKNTYLLKPQNGMVITKLALVTQKRIENIQSWVRKHSNFQDLLLTLDAILDNLVFGVQAEKFEQAWNDVGAVLGFACQRPDKEWKEGPDNLWCLRDSEYLLVECKSQVQEARQAIDKNETGQMNNSCAWFKRNYAHASVKNIMIIPTKTIARAAGFNEPVQVMRKKELSSFVKNVKKFFIEFRELDLQNISERKVQELLEAHMLSVNDILNKYSCITKNLE